MLERCAPTDWLPELRDRLPQGAQIARLTSDICVLSLGQFPVNPACLLSSRISRNLRGETQWFDALESLGQTMRRRNVTLITTKKTTVHPFAESFAARHGLSLTELTFFGKPGTRRRLLDLANRDSLIAFRASDAFHQPLRPIERTQILACLATELYVVCATACSQTKAIVDNRLGEDRPRSFAFSAAVERTLHRGWESQGGVLVPPIFRKRLSFCPVIGGDLAPICDFPADDGDWLFHWTRNQQRWPDQSQRQFVDDLLSAKATTESSPLFALHRILSQRKLIASQIAIRGQSKVVCLSAAPLEKLRQGRVYRKHRLRWDYEPYGLLIRRKALQRIGAQPVWYGTGEDWESATATNRPFFQMKSSRLNWSEEQEWRFIGDLDLDRITPRDIIVFVPSEAEARFLSRVSHWSLAVIRP